MNTYIKTPLFYLDLLLASLVLSTFFMISTVCASDLNSLALNSGLYSHVAANSSEQNLTTALPNSD